MATSSAQFTSEFSNPNLDVLITEEQIRDRIKELGVQITHDYAGLNPLLIGVLKGACFFLSDLLRAIDTRLGIEFMAISSYGSSTRTSGEVRIMKDLDVPIEGRHILVVEDIVDTGLTLSYLLANLKSRGAASVMPCSSARMRKANALSSRLKTSAAASQEAKRSCSRLSASDAGWIARGSVSVFSSRGRPCMVRP